MEVRASYLKGMRQPFLMDVFAGTSLETAARAKGHCVVTPGAGDLTLRAERLKMLEHVRHHRPYFLVLFATAGTATTFLYYFAGRLARSGSSSKTSSSICGSPGATTKQGGETFRSFAACLRSFLAGSGPPIFAIFAWLFAGRGHLP